MEDGYAAALRLLRRPSPPTALIALNDILALATIRTANKLGLHIPDDLSVIGFDDISLARFFSPPLTAVRTDAEKTGRIAVRLLWNGYRIGIDRFKGQGFHPVGRQRINRQSENLKLIDHPDQERSRV